MEDDRSNWFFFKGAAVQDGVVGAVCRGRINLNRRPLMHACMAGLVWRNDEVLPDN
jgi:hypothetical protein